MYLGGFDLFFCDDTALPYLLHLGIPIHLFRLALSGILSC